MACSFCLKPSSLGLLTLQHVIYSQLAHCSQFNSAADVCMVQLERAFEGLIPVCQTLLSRVKLTITYATQSQVNPEIGCPAVLRATPETCQAMQSSVVPDPNQTEQPLTMDCQGGLRPLRRNRALFLGPNRLHITKSAGSDIAQCSSLRSLQNKAAAPAELP